MPASTFVAALFVLLAVAVLPVPLAAQAQQSSKIPRIGLLANVRSSVLEAFVAGLRQLGYVEGQNIAIEWRLAEGRFDRLPALAVELAQLKVDVILAPGPPYVNAAKNATTTIPIVFALVPDPVATGLVASMARPGGNMTGLATNEVEMQEKRLELLKEMIPGLGRIAVLTNPGSDDRHRAVERATALLGIQRETVTVARAEEIDEAFTVMKAKRVDAVMELPRSPLFFAHRQRIADLAVQNRLPAACYSKEYVEAGCLLYYGASLPDVLRRSAQYVDKILKGARPGELPVEQPTKFELVINIRTARALGLTIPPALLLRADQVIE
jgi:putative tryptophan/tyrosine transport system substrate-binding protein